MNYTLHELATTGLAIQAPSTWAPNYTLPNGLTVSFIEGVINPQALQYQIELLGSLREDPMNKATMVVINSGGGSPDRNVDFGHAVQLYALAKPVFAYIQDFGGSAAYKIASYFPKIYANPDAQIGALGAFIKFQSKPSATEEFLGEVHVIGDGESTLKVDINKGELTSELKEFFSKMAKQLTVDFKRTLVQNRAALTDENVSTLFTGEFWPAEQALAFGLIDGIMPWIELSDWTIEQLGNIQEDDDMSYLKDFFTKPPTPEAVASADALRLAKLEITAGAQQAYSVLTPAAKAIPECEAHLGRALLLSLATSKADDVLEQFKSTHELLVARPTEVLQLVDRLFPISTTIFQFNMATMGVATPLAGVAAIQGFAMQPAATPPTGGTPAEATNGGPVLDHNQQALVDIYKKQLQTKTVTTG